eukprot:9503081-Pyramimonas_sp.AAC.1
MRANCIFAHKAFVIATLVDGKETHRRPASSGPQSSQSTAPRRIRNARDSRTHRPKPARFASTIGEISKDTLRLPALQPFLKMTLDVGGTDVQQIYLAASLISQHGGGKHIPPNPKQSDESRRNGAAGASPRDPA